MTNMPLEKQVAGDIRLETQAGIALILVSSRASLRKIAKDQSLENYRALQR
jgi:hypothetical protein